MKTCLNCSEPFTGRQANAKHCSRKCSNAYWRKTRTAECSERGCVGKVTARGLCSTHYNRAHQPDRHAKVELPCAQCGAATLKHRSNLRRPFCDYTCRDLYSLEHGLGAWGREPKPEPMPRAHHVDLRSPLRRAWESGDHDGVITAIKAHSDVRPNGCWEWRRSLSRDGYGTVTLAGRRMGTHRVALEAKIGRPLGKQPAHHICANTFCVNPDHLVPVTAASNNAEMMGRRYMESRIRDLEAALALHEPLHPLLLEAGISLAG